MRVYDLPQRRVKESFLHLLFPRFLQLGMVTLLGGRGHACDGVSWARQALTSHTTSWSRNGASLSTAPRLRLSDARKFSKIIWGRGDQHSTANFIFCQISTLKINPIITIISFLNDLLTLQNGKKIISGKKHTSKQINLDLWKMIHSLRILHFAKDWWKLSGPSMILFHCLKPGTSSPDPFPQDRTKSLGPCGMGGLKRDTHPQLQSCVWFYLRLPPS